MGIELSGAGEALTAIVVSDELSKEVGKSPSGHKDDNGDQNDHANINCANCGTQLTGAFCHACGQSAHIHRSLLHMLEEALHGILHFDTKAWRTIPALIFRPGQLTREYIQGKRTSYVSPLALFLFSMFLMFFIFSYTTTWKNNELIKLDDSREDIVKKVADTETTLKKKRQEKSQLDQNSEDHLGLQIEIREYEAQLQQFQDTLDNLDGKPISVLEAKQTLAQTEQTLNDLKAQKNKLKQEKSIKNKNSVERSTTDSASNSANSSTVELTSKLDSSNANERKKTIDNNSTWDIASLKPWELNQEIRFMEKQVKYHKKRVANAIAQQNKSSEDHASKSTEAPPAATIAGTSASDVVNTSSIDTNTKDTNGKIDELSQIPYIGKTLADLVNDRELTLYKMKKNAASAAILIIPISLPFIWLLFAFSRKYVMFDHAVFSLYSLSFMSILMMVVSILSYFEFNVTSGLLLAFAPPIHMFSQLRHAYRLGMLSSLWRTVALLFIASISISLYAVLVTILSA